MLAWANAEGLPSNFIAGLKAMPLNGRSLLELNIEEVCQELSFPAPAKAQIAEAFERLTTPSGTSLPVCLSVYKSGGLLIHQLSVANWVGCDGK